MVDGEQCVLIMYGMMNMLVWYVDSWDLDQENILILGVDMEPFY